MEKKRTNFLELLAEEQVPRKRKRQTGDIDKNSTTNEKKVLTNTLKLLNSDKEKHTMELCIPKAFSKIFQNVFEKHTSNVFSNMTLIFKESGMFIVAQGESVECALCVDMKRDFFYHFNLKEGARYIITVRTHDLDICFKSLSLFENCFFYFEDDVEYQSRIKIKMINTNNSIDPRNRSMIQTTYINGQLKAKSITPLFFQRLRYTHQWETSSNQFHDIINNLSRNGEQFSIATNYKKIIFHVSCQETGGETEIELIPKEITKNDDGEEEENFFYDKYITKTLNLAVKMKILSSVIYIHLKQNQPLFIKYPFIDTTLKKEVASIKFVVAPIKEDDHGRNKEIFLTKFKE